MAIYFYHAWFQTDTDATDDAAIDIDLEKIRQSITCADLSDMLMDFSLEDIQASG